MNSIRLTGRGSNFCEILAARIERMGIHLRDDGFHIHCWDGSDDVVECGIVIFPSTVTNESASSCQIVIHDLYIPRGSQDWGPNEIEDQLHWLKSGVGNSPDGSARYWIHVRDVVDAIAVLLSSQPKGRLDICGRRSWSHYALQDEVAMLFERVQAAKTHTFGAKHLAINEPKIEPSESPERPDLSPIHSALQAAGTSGWYPTIPLRVGLMECIAHHLEGNSSD